jgi:plastocyanin
MRDNIFVVNNLKVKAGQEVTIRIINEGQNPHNLRVAGPDGQWGSGDDFAVPADGSFIQGGQQAEAVFTPYQPGVYSFRCDVHPTDMWGIITVEQ